MKRVSVWMKRVLFLATLAAAGCHRSPVIDERLLACLEEARAWQHRADVHLADGAAAEAISDVRNVLQIAFPAGAPEGEEARLDARARLAELFLDGGDGDRAMAEVELGRREATFDSFYRAHLETVGGEILEARAKTLPDAAARDARQQALAAYQRSIEINKRVQSRLAKESP
jgi:hypothetical protein